MKMNFIKRNNYQNQNQNQNQNRLRFLNPLNLFNIERLEKRKRNKTIDTLFQRYNKQKTKYGFIAPNELFPCDTREIFGNVPENGIYVGVGTDRTLAHTYNASKIIQIDMNPIVVLFNIFNTEMIKSCPDRQKYLDIRKKILSDYDVNMLINDIQSETSLHDSFNNTRLEQFINAFRDINKSNNKDIFTIIHTPSHDENIHGFNNSYLHNDDEFIRIKNLAVTGQIKSYQANLANKKELEQCLSDHETISVLDISNAWLRKYRLSTCGIEYLMQEKMSNQSFLLATDNVAETGTRATYHLYHKDDFKGSVYGREIGFNR